MRNAPDQPTWYAFFDVDGTLISIKSMFSFLDYMVEELNIAGSPQVSDYRARLARMIAEEAPREDINRFYYSIYAGLDVELVEQLGRQWYGLVRNREGLFLSRMLEEIRWHQRQGARIVLVSGSFRAILQPLAEELRIDDLICAPLEVRAGRYTGQLTGTPTIGQGKAEGMRAYAQRQPIEATRCYAYGDDISDVPMLEMVGNPSSVNPDAAFRDLCKQRSWNIIEAA
jgi:HAD superfamily hydrolase (TIGR01490 family)